jgi:hypothetical protein
MGYNTAMDRTQLLWDIRVERRTRAQAIAQHYPYATETVDGLLKLTDNEQRIRDLLDHFLEIGVSDQNVIPLGRVFILASAR